ncbi:hypothetical protein K3728_07980 [Rhodobacteraceae bacterium M385]|nr:hypothetical protein K3728_07980 [Rhodobacteraceae bacterium M385]
MEYEFFWSNVQKLGLSIEQALAAECCELQMKVCFVKAAPQHNAPWRVSGLGRLTFWVERAIMLSA